jgi:hypothetical protein
MKGKSTLGCFFFFFFFFLSRSLLLLLLFLAKKQKITLKIVAKRIFFIALRTVNSMLTNYISQKLVNHIVAWALGPSRST